MMASFNLEKDINEYEQILRPFAFNLTKSMEATEDLIQDTFYRALANQEKFIEGTNIKAWLFTIMRNIFINNYRKSQKQNVITDFSENQYLLNSTKKVEKNESERTFMSDDITFAMKQVSQDFIVPFLMYHNGFQYQEIADKMRIPLGTVKSRIFFARKELQARLKERGVVNSSDN